MLHSHGMQRPSFPTLNPIFPSMADGRAMASSGGSTSGGRTALVGAWRASTAAARSARRRWVTAKGSRGAGGGAAMPSTVMTEGSWARMSWWVSRCGLARGWSLEMCTVMPSTVMTEGSWARMSWWVSRCGLARGWSLEMCTVMPSTVMTEGSWARMSWWVR